jgi:hypothetical protein
MTRSLGVEPKKVGVTPDGTPRTTWEPNSNTRIRHESHPEGLSPGDPGYNPRRHGEHYHVCRSGIGGTSGVVFGVLWPATRPRRCSPVKEELTKESMWT